MKKRYMYAAGLFIIVAIALFFVSLSQDSQSKLVYITMPIGMFSGVMALLFYVWGTNAKRYEFLKDYGFDLSKTFVSTIYPLTAGNFSRARRVPAYLIAFYEAQDEFKFVEIRVTDNPATTNSVISTYELPVAALREVIFKTRLGTTLCFMALTGLTDRMSSEIQQAASTGFFEEKMPEDTLMVSTILSRSQYDTHDVVALLGDLVRRRSVKVVNENLKVSA